MKAMEMQWRQLTWLAIFSIAMAFLETAVVVYLRKIYYPEGFDFPLTPMDPQLVVIEWLREVATVLMLAGVGILAGRSPNQRLAFFLAAFSIWDIFYYAFLKLLLGWPESLLTWDILFLIPVPWIGPVLAPCLISLTLLLLAAVIYSRDLQNPAHRLNGREWSFLTLGSLLVILSWTRDYLMLSKSRVAASVESSFIFSDYVPQSYNWWLFAMAEVLLLTGIFLFWKRTKVLVY
jgi:hypothetical protein